MQREIRIFLDIFSARIRTITVSALLSLSPLVPRSTKLESDPLPLVKTFADYESFLPKHDKFKQGHLHDPFMPAQEVRQKLDQIRGHLVWMPLDFLKDAEMAEKGLQVNAYTESIYT